MYSIHKQIESLCLMVPKNEKLHSKSTQTRKHTFFTILISSSEGFMVPVGPEVSATGFPGKLQGSMNLYTSESFNNSLLSISSTDKKLREINEQERRLVLNIRKKTKNTFLETNLKNCLLLF